MKSRWKFILGIISASIVLVAWTGVPGAEGAELLKEVAENPDLIYGLFQNQGGLIIVGVLFFKTFTKVVTIAKDFVDLTKEFLGLMKDLIDLLNELNKKLPDGGICPLGDSAEVG